MNKSPPIPGLDGAAAPFSENLSRENRREHIGGFVLIRDGEAADPRSAVHRSCLYPPPMGLPRVEKLRRIYRSKTSLASGCKWKLMRTLGILAGLRWSDSLSLFLCTGLNCFSRWFIGPNLDTTGSKSILLLRGPLSTGVLVALCIELCLRSGNYYWPRYRETFIDVLCDYIISCPIFPTKELNYSNKVCYKVDYTNQIFFIFNSSKNSFLSLARSYRYLFLDRIHCCFNISLDSYKYIYPWLYSKKKGKTREKRWSNDWTKHEKSRKNLYRITPVEFPWYK